MVPGPQLKAPGSLQANPGPQMSPHTQDVLINVLLSGNVVTSPLNPMLLQASHELPLHRLLTLFPFSARTEGTN